MRGSEGARLKSESRYRSKSQDYVVRRVRKELLEEKK